jgi:hypothetical protein
MALILDVARFKYPPHWVPLRLLWDAMNMTDDSTGLLRGSLLLPTFHSLLIILSWGMLIKIAIPLYRSAIFKIVLCIIHSTYSIP